LFKNVEEPDESIYNGLIKFLKFCENKIFLNSVSIAGWFLDKKTVQKTRKENIDAETEKYEKLHSPVKHPNAIG
jgi:hypothetical protein